VADFRAISGWRVGSIPTLGGKNGERPVCPRIFPFIPTLGGKNGERPVCPRISTQYFRHGDYLGSKRIVTDINGNSVYTTQSLPFGDGLTTTGTPGSKDDSSDYFTDQPYDFLSNLTEFPARNYSTQMGRWMHTDPAGLASADPGNPQTWNRYAYALNNPVNAIDPFGLDCVYLNDDGSVSGTMSGDGPCEGDNAFFFDGTVDPNSLAVDNNGNVVASVNGQLQCSGDSGCGVYASLTSITVNGGSAPQVNLLFSGLPPSAFSPMTPTATIGPAPQQPKPPKPGCWGKGAWAGAKAAGRDIVPGPPGSDPGGDLTSKPNQAIIAGTLYQAANAARTLAPLADAAADFVPVAGQVWAGYQVVHALYTGGQAMKESIDECNGD
jgi:RHS repeat-associated protein